MTVLSKLVYVLFILQISQSLHDIPQELTYIIKQDIAGINKQIASLQAYVKQRNTQGSARSPEGKQVDEHNNNVVMLLQSKLASTSMTFKDVLEVRTQVCFSIQVPLAHGLMHVKEHERIQRSN
jgi:hypothetical protein